MSYYRSKETFISKSTWLRFTKIDQTVHFELQSAIVSFSKLKIELVISIGSIGLAEFLLNFLQNQEQQNKLVNEQKDFN